jgi:hypothetical protein
MGNSRLEGDEVVRVEDERAILDLDPTAAVESVEELRLVLVVVIGVLGEPCPRIEGRDVVIVRFEVQLRGDFVALPRFLCVRFEVGQVRSSMSVRHWFVIGLSVVYDRSLSRSFAGRSSIGRWLFALFVLVESPPG